MLKRKEYEILNHIIKTILSEQALGRDEAASPF